MFLVACGSRVREMCVLEDGNVDSKCERCGMDRAEIMSVSHI